MAASKDNMNLR